MLILDNEDIDRLKDYLKYVNINTNTLSNHIGSILLDRGYLFCTSDLEPFCEEFLKDRTHVYTHEVEEFISSMNLDNMFMKESNNATNDN